MKSLYVLKLIGVIAITAIFAGFNDPWEKHPVKHRKTAEEFVVDTLATGLTVPWEIIFLPDGTMIFSERNGKVRLYRNKQLLSRPALVIKETDTTKKMGLLGMCLHPQFTKNNYLYLSYNYKRENTSFLKIVRYQLVNDTLIHPTPILEDIRASQNHTGCRLKFGADGKLLITTGDADRPVLAQDLKSLNGKILRVNDNGSFPADNPFILNDTARKEIWSYGHRNPQGIDFQPVTNQLFNSEHGPNGGDEINIIKKGSNYGWPVIHHQDAKEGMVSPFLEYSPSIGPSQIVFYTANAFPSFKGNLLVACLRGEKIIRFQIKGNQVISEDNLFEHSYGRIRALNVGPEGYIYFSTSQNDPPEGRPRPGYDMILRLRPSSNRTIIRNAVNSRKEVKAKEVAVKKTPAVTYTQLCASCHGNNLEGSIRAKSLVDGKWEYGSKRNDIIKSIRDGIIEKGMPAWEGTITKKETENLADLILRRTKKK